MAKGVPILGKDPLGKAKYANVTESGDLRVQLSGNMVAIGLHANRPDANAVTPGFIYYSVDLEENKLSYSDGTSWVVMS